MNLKDLGNLRDGWVNYFKARISNLDPEIKELAETRAAICSTCPKFEIQQLRFIPATKTIVKNGPMRGRCAMCGCVFPAIVLAPNKKCPLNKW